MLTYTDKEQSKNNAKEKPFRQTDAITECVLNLVNSSGGLHNKYLYQSFVTATKGRP